MDARYTKDVCQECGDVWCAGCRCPECDNRDADCFCSVQIF